MKTKIVYVVVSTSNDIYLEQAYISMYSVKYHMPDSHIVLLTDKLTEATFVGVREEEIKYADEVIPVELPAHYNAMKRSRILKTSVRKHVEGDFLFIDTDTIIVKPLYEIDNMKVDIAACWDTHSSFHENPFYSGCVREGRKLGWPIESEEAYFNSGVIYVRDSEVAHSFYDLWNKNLLDGFKKKVFMDQPSFAKTNYMLDHVVKRMDDTWNCELKYGVKYLKDAKIVHYLCTNKSRNVKSQLFILNEQAVLETVKKNAEIDCDIENAVKDPFTGLASVSQTFSGRDLFFFRSATFELFRHLYDKKIFSFIESMIKYILWAMHKIKVL